MIPERIGRYQIKAELGRGGMATVYQAYDPLFERDVAIKVLPREFLHDPQFRARFEREAKAVASLEHPAIVPVYDFGEDEGQPYIVMRLMSGGSLTDLLLKGAIPLRQSVEIIGRIAPALDAAHSHGIIHRDLKPGNILLDQYGNAFLSDFGIARVAAAGGATLTGTNVIGTPAYMSPEQIQGDKALDGRSDIYALGVIMFQMLTGNLPYQSDTPAKLMMAHLLNPVPHALELNPKLPPGCEPVIQHALAKERDQRFSTAAEMTGALQAAVAGEIPTTPPAWVAATPPGGIPPAPATRVLEGAETANATRLSTGPYSAQATIASAVPGPAQTLAAAPAAPPARRKTPAWLFLIGGLLAVGAVGAGVLLTLSFLNSAGAPGRAARPAAATTAAPAALALPSPTPTQPPPSPTPLPPSPTPEPSATRTPAPSPTPQPSPTPAPTEPPRALALGGADMIAFLNANDIWAASLDGSQLKQLTDDGGIKTNLQWTPDGRAVNYISGKCVKSVQLESGRVDNLLCVQAVEFLETFEVSPDGSQVAVSIDREMYIVPYDLERLSQVRLRGDLRAMGQCQYTSPYTRNAVKFARWSRDGQKIAVTILGASGGSRIDLVQVLDISRCVDRPPRLDEFPAQRFVVKGYDASPVIQNFDWDGDYLFAFVNFVRNDGFGDLYVYNFDLHTVDNDLRPIEQTCCYRDPQWSPDGQYLLLAFQDLRLGSQSVTQLYYIPFGSIGTGVRYTPIPLPEGFLSNPREKPLPALRPAVP
jgi:serine/threonine-protein kinase